jgi:hypothetical protein
MVVELSALEVSFANNCCDLQRRELGKFPKSRPTADPPEKSNCAGGSAAGT